MTLGPGGQEVTLPTLALQLIAVSHTAGAWYSSR